MSIATFDPVAFKVRYPQFATVSNSLLQAYFDEAGLYLSNTDTSPVQNITRRTMLLWMLTAHIATLNGAGSADGQPAPVGRLSQASEGSVSVSYDGPDMTPGTGAWFQQTQYGSSFWAATSSLRGFRYIPQPRCY